MAMTMMIRRTAPSCAPDPERSPATIRTISVHGPASPADVRRSYLRTACWPDWSPQIRRVRPAGAVLAPGLSGTVVGPCGLRVRFVIEQVDGEGADWTWRVRCLGVRARLRHTVEPAGGGARVTLTLVGPPAVCLLYPVLARRALRRLVSVPGRQGQSSSRSLSTAAWLCSTSLVPVSRVRRLPRTLSRSLSRAALPSAESSSSQ